MPFIAHAAVLLEEDYTSYEKDKRKELNLGFLVPVKAIILRRHNEKLYVYISNNDSNYNHINNTGYYF